MRTLVVSFLLVQAVASYAQETRDIPRLSGIVNLPGLKKAVLEFPSRPCEGPRQLLLREGDHLWGSKVVSIYPERRAADVAVDGAQGPLTLTLGASSNSVRATVGTIELVDASLHSVLELYGELSEKTLLHWPVLPDVRFTLWTSITNRTEAALLLQNTLAEMQILTVADGDKFTMIVPRDQASAVKPRAPKPKATATGKSASEELPPGSISFHGVMIDQVFMIYAELIGARLDRSAPRLAPTQPFIFLYTGTPLSKEECVYAFDTLFGWQGIRMTRAPDGSVRPVQEVRK